MLTILPIFSFLFSSCLPGHGGRRRHAPVVGDPCVPIAPPLIESSLLPIVNFTTAARFSRRAASPGPTDLGLDPLEEDESGTPPSTARGGGLLHPRCNDNNVLHPRRGGELHP